MRKNDRSLRNGIQISCKLKSLELLESVFREYPQTLQCPDVDVLKSEVDDVVNQLIQTGEYTKSTTKGQGPEKPIEISPLFGLALLEISCHHGELIKVC